MATPMRLLPVRVSPPLRRLIDQVGPINPATRALLLLGGAAAGLDLRGLEREVAALLAADLDPRVVTALRQMLVQQLGEANAGAVVPAGATSPSVTDSPDVHDGLPDDPLPEDPFATVGIDV